MAVAIQILGTASTGVVGGKSGAGVLELPAKVVRLDTVGSLNLPEGKIFEISSATGSDAVFFRVQLKTDNTQAGAATDSIRLDSGQSLSFALPPGGLWSNYKVDVRAAV